MTEGRKQSPYFDSEDEDVNGGVPGYRRDQIYKYLFDNTDRYGIIAYNINDLARAVEMDPSRFRTICSELVELGVMDKPSHGKWRCIVDPDKYDWGDSFLKKSKEVRKQFQSYYRNKQRRENGGSS